MKWAHIAFYIDVHAHARAHRHTCDCDSNKSDKEKHKQFNIKCLNDTKNKIKNALNKISARRVLRSEAKERKKASVREYTKIFLLCIYATQRTHRSTHVCNKSNPFSNDAAHKVEVYHRARTQPAAFMWLAFVTRCLHNRAITISFILRSILLILLAICLHLGGSGICALICMCVVHMNKSKNMTY